MNEEDLAELVELQIATQGCSVMRANDGHVLVFTAELLRRLSGMAEAHEDKRAIIFVKHGLSA